MGVIKFFSSDSYPSCNLSRQKQQSKKIKGNPDPSNYRIIKYDSIDESLVVLIKYFDCDNYEGRKILVYENCLLEELKNQGLIDPHFSENKNYKSPIARFEPTDRGWLYAKNFCGKLKSMNQEIVRFKKSDE